MRFPCLVVDHDDTVVDSTATVHFPCFVEYMAKYHPNINYTLEQYLADNFDPGIVALFRDIIGMNDEEIAHEERYWNEYVRNHVPKAYEGIRELLWEQKNRGGKLCVVSHSFTHNILRDYRENGLPEPDMVFGWESEPDKRKPSTYPLLKIMAEYGLEPAQLLMLDDLKPGYDMARACGVSFAAAGWSNDVPQIESFMRANCGLYFKTVHELRAYLFE